MIESGFPTPTGLSRMGRRSPRPSPRGICNPPGATRVSVDRDPAMELDATRPGPAEAPVSCGSVDCQEPQELLYMIF